MFGKVFGKVSGRVFGRVFGKVFEKPPPSGCMLLSLAMRLIVSNDLFFLKNFLVPSAKSLGDLLARKL